MCRRYSTTVTVTALSLVLLSGSRILAHETDQFSTPAGRELADLGDHFTRLFYGAIERGVTKTNQSIRSAVESGQRGGQLESLQSDFAVAQAVNREFPYAILFIEQMDKQMTSPQMRAEYPGYLTGYKPPPTLQKVIAYPLNPFRAWGCATMNVFGVQLGADKIGHFTDMGMHYYQTYKGYLAKGESEEQAIRRAIEVGMHDPLKAESGLLGYWTAGAYSNADNAVNYLGFVFYRNLTEPQRLKGEIRPPMLVRDGPYWRIAPHVRPDSDFFSWFISDHIDEALNPSHYLPNMRDTIRDLAKRNAEGVLEHRRDRWGNRRSQGWFAQQAEVLRTYWGFDYGHNGPRAELIRISDVCFAAPSDPNGRDRAGRSPLHRAVAQADVKAVEQLLARGADVNEPVRSDENFNSNWGDTPLHMAAQDGREEIVRLLVARGADVNRTNDRGNTPLHRAVEYPGVMALLFDAGANIESADLLGRTPLHWAALGAPRSSMGLLLARGADVNSRDAEGQTPLHYAARSGDTGAIGTLLARGADPNAADRFGASPLHVSTACNQWAATNELLGGGAVASARDAFGKAAMDEQQAQLARSSVPPRPRPAVHY